MKKRAARVSLIALEIVAIVLAAATASAAFLYWRLERGPVSLALFKPSVEFAVARALPERHSCEVAAIELMRGERGGDYTLKLSKVRIIDPNKDEAASAPEINMSFSVGDILSGAVGPKTITANGAKFRIVRNDAQSVEIPGVRGRQKKSNFAVLSPLFDGMILKSAFESAKFTNAEITFSDIASGRSWVAPNASAELHRQDSGLLAAINGDIDMDGVPAALDADALYTEKSGIISVEVNGANFPVGDILSMFYGENAAVLDAPVTGKAAISFTAAGDVLSSSLSARVEGGALKLASESVPVKFIEWEAAFDPKKNEFQIDQFAFDIDGSSGIIDGNVAITFGDDVRKPESIGFDLNGANIILNLHDRLSEPLQIDSAALTGAYAVSDRRISLNILNLVLLDIGVGGNFAMTFPRAAARAPAPSVGVTANINVEGSLDAQRLLKIWPIGVAMGARDWIEDRLSAATIENINAKMDLAPGAVSKDGLMPDEAMTVTFDVRDAKAYYVKAMTPLTAASGSGTLRGNSFMLKADRGRVGDITISEGEVEFPTFIPKWEPTYFRFTAVGKSETILGVLDEKPLSLLSKINLAPGQFTGDTRARIEIMRPNKRDVPTEDYRYSGKATFNNMDVSGLAGDADLTGANGTVDLKARSLTVKADAFLSEAPIKLVWRQNFFRQDGPSSINIAGTIDSSTGDLFGISSRQFMRGPVQFSAHALGEIGAMESLDIKADFSNAALYVDALGWRKPANAPAHGDITINFDSEHVEIEKVAINGEGVAIEGSLAFSSGGVLKSAEIPKLYLDDAADLALTTSRSPTGELVVMAVGDYLNAAPMVQQIVEGPGGDGGEGGGFDWGNGLSLTARIDLMNMRQGVEYRHTALDLWRDADRLQALDFSAFDHDGPPLKISMAHTGEDDGPLQRIEAHTGEIGGLLAGIFGITSIRGGEGTMSVDLRDPGQPGFSGIIEARDMQIVEAPLLARIFSAGSLEGLANLLNGEGIDLSYAYGEFDFAKGVLSVRDMRATGPSVGITADGAVDMGDGGDISLNGAMAPLYQLNSILGAAPIIGDILVGKKGEGIFALSYTVSGARAAPAVFVNPLSALTPGIFRRLMQPPRTDISPVSEDTDTQAKDEATPSR